MRIVIDTNLWVSFLITKQFNRLTPLILSKEIVLVFSNELLAEFLTVTQRPKFSKYFSQSDIADLLEIFDEFVEFINVKTNVTICRDAKDNFLLALAIDGDADYLLTGDYDLLDLNPQGKTQIIKISDFYKGLNF